MHLWNVLRSALYESIGTISTGGMFPTVIWKDLKIGSFGTLLPRRSNRGTSSTGVSSVLLCFPERRTDGKPHGDKPSAGEPIS